MCKHMDILHCSIFIHMKKRTLQCVSLTRTSALVSRWPAVLMRTSKPSLTVFFWVCFCSCLKPSCAAKFSARRGISVVWFVSEVEVGKGWGASISVTETCFSYEFYHYTLCRWMFCCNTVYVISAQKCGGNFVFKSEFSPIYLQRSALLLEIRSYLKRY